MRKRVEIYATKAGIRFEIVSVGEGSNQQWWAVSQTGSLSAKPLTTKSNYGESLESFKAALEKIAAMSAYNSKCAR